MTGLACTTPVLPERNPVAAFRAALAESGFLLPADIAGVYGRSAKFERIIDAIDGLIGRLYQNDRAETLRFPPAIPRTTFAASKYFSNFPHLTGTIHCFCGDDQDHKLLLEAVADGGDWTGRQQFADLVMTPAACYPVYPLIAGRGPLPEEGWLVDASSYCFRHEPSDDPVRMQMFRQREQVCFGTAEQIRNFQTDWMGRAADMFARLMLPAEIDLANDPFFGRLGQMMANGQRSQRLKFEILVPISDPERPNPCGSFNYHVDHFASAFGIYLPDGSIAHTGCAGFGLERIALALLRHHGFQPGEWPASVKAALWPAAA
jgi:seryl-tRNA synthetase